MKKLNNLQDPMNAQGPLANLSGQPGVRGASRVPGALGQQPGPLQTMPHRMNYSFPVDATVAAGIQSEATSVKDQVVENLEGEWVF